MTGPRAAAVTARLRATSQRFHTAFTERDGALELDLAAPETREGPSPVEPAQLRSEGGRGP